MQVTVNYLQTTAVVVAVNVHWTVGVVALFETAGANYLGFSLQGE